MDNASEKTPLVGIIMGSKSDMPVMEAVSYTHLDVYKRQI